jgi:DNA-binding MarR family transcriptional regulator
MRQMNGMHALSFRFKRAHLTAVKIGKMLVADVEGMTPARFDILYLIRRLRIEKHPYRRVESGWHSQTALRHELGLHRSTMSKMLTRLLEMGWVERRRSSFDRRRCNIALTKLGLRKVAKAMRILFRQKKLRKMYERVLPTTKEMHVVERIHRLVVILQRMAYAFGDRARVWFDYGSPEANRQIVFYTEPRWLRWIRLAREHARAAAT